LSVFKSKKGDCLGYSRLITYLMRLGGIPARIYFSYLYDKKENPVFANYGNDIFHAVIAIFYPNYGWIAMEPQRMFLNLTSKHILLFPEEDIPKKVIKYQESRTGEKLFYSEDDENDYLKNIFLDKFIKGIKDTLIKTEQNYKVVGISILMDDKGISSPNSIFENTVLPEISFDSEKKIKKIFLIDFQKNMVMSLEFIEPNKVLRMFSNNIKLYTLYDGEKYHIFGLKKGNYGAYFTYKGLPFKMLKIDVADKNNKIKQIEVNYCLKKGNFKKVKIEFSNNQYVQIKEHKTGFTFIQGLNVDNFPLYMDYNSKYFFIFGMKKGKYAIKFYSNNRIEKINYNNGEK